MIKTYYVTADVDRAATAAELKEIGVGRARVFAGRVKAIIAAETPKDACEKGRECIAGCINPGLLVANVGCMPVADAKKLGDDAVYKSYPTTTWLLYYRIKAGMTQAQLAEKSGVNVRQIQRVELGESEAGNLTASNLIALADALGVDVKSLV